VHRRATDDFSFPEQLAKHMEKSDDKIQSITARLDPFEGGNQRNGEEDGNSLDDILLHSDYAINALYKGHVGVDLSRGQKQRKVHVKTTLKKAIFLMKVFPYTETIKFYVVSPRKILVHSRLQMEKVFYSDHYYVDIFWNFDENLT